jgi:hypothetical protein
MPGNLHRSKAVQRCLEIRQGWGLRSILAAVNRSLVRYVLSCNRQGICSPDSHACRAHLTVAVTTIWLRLLQTHYQVTLSVLGS